MGTPYLKKLLNKQLYAHIKQFLPLVHKELVNKLTDLRKKVKDFNAEIGRNLSDPFSIQFYMVK